MGGKTPKFNAPQNPYGKLTVVRSDNPFVNTASKLQKVGKNYRQDTTSQLAPDLQQARDTSGAGLNTNLQYLQQDPTQRMATITGGGDLYYNALQGQLNRAEQQATGRSQLAARSRGLTNSTTQGTALAQIANDRLQRDREAMLGAFGLGQNTATQNVGTNQGVLGSLYNMVQPMTQQTSSQLMQGRQFGDQMALNIAQQQYAADKAAADAKNAMIGNIIKAGLSVGLAPFTGGASLTGLTSLNMGGSGGGGGGQSSGMNFSLPSWLGGTPAMAPSASGIPGASSNYFSSQGLGFV
jgi:hypothetical protein